MFAELIAPLIGEVIAGRDPWALEGCYAAVEDVLALSPGIRLPPGPIVPAAGDRARLCGRERILGPATIAADAMGLMLRLARATAGSLQAAVVHHPPSFSAAAKQAALGPGILTHKTITARIGPHLVLCTGVGDFAVDRPTMRELGARLNLSQAERRRITLNPSDVIPELAFGLLRGIVSPFIATAEQSGVAALVVLLPAGEIRDRLVAIPLSPCESLVVTVEALLLMVRSFAARRLRGVRIMTAAPSGAA
jgi:hypothetical protein